MKKVQCALLVMIGVLLLQGLAVGFNFGMPDRRQSEQNMCNKERSNLQTGTVKRETETEKREIAKTWTDKQATAEGRASIESGFGNQLEAEALLREELENFDLKSLLEVKLVDSIQPEIQSSKDGVVVMRYAFVVQYSQQKYFKEFLPRLDRLLTKISNGKPRVRILEDAGRMTTRFTPIVENRSGGSEWAGHTVPGIYYRNQNNILSQNVTLRKKSASAIVRIEPNGDVRLKEWPLSDLLLNTFVEVRNKIFSQNKELMCILSVLDKSGNDLSGASVVLPFWYNRVEEQLLPPFLLASNRQERHYGAFGMWWYTQHFGYVDVAISRDDLRKMSPVPRLELKDKTAWLND